MRDCGYVSTLVSSKPSNLIHTKFNAKEMPHSRLVEKLLYVSNCACPDIIASANHLYRCILHPEAEHRIKAKRVLRYLKGTLDKGLMLSK